MVNTEQPTYRKPFISELHHMQSDYMFLPSNLTASIMSRRSIDLWIKGLSLKRRVWEQNSWPWHIRTVRTFVAFGTNHSPIGEVGSFLWNVKKCVLIPCREYSHGLLRPWVKQEELSKMWRCFCKCCQEISAVLTHPFAKLRKTRKLRGETPDAELLF